jgi:hypothetical protein
MGLLIGSVSAIIQTVELLSQHELVLNNQVLALIDQCVQIPADFDISYPNTKVRRIIAGISSIEFKSDPQLFNRILMTSSISIWKFLILRSLRKPFLN